MIEMVGLELSLKVPDLTLEWTIILEVPWFNKCHSFVLGYVNSRSKLNDLRSELLLQYSSVPISVFWTGTWILWIPVFFLPLDWSGWQNPFDWLFDCQCCFFALYDLWLFNTPLNEAISSLFDYVAYLEKFMISLFYWAVAMTKIYWYLSLINYRLLRLICNAIYIIFEAPSIKIFDFWFITFYLFGLLKTWSLDLGTNIGTIWIWSCKCSEPWTAN